MGLDINRALSVGAINSNMAISPFRTSFGNSYTDSFQSASVSRYVSENAIKYAIQINPRIKEILNEAGVPLKVNMEELDELIQTHAKETQEIATGIIANLPQSLKQHVNVKSVKDAAYLHDVGKVFIPVEILNKNGKLDEREKEIMHLHSELGYELLKNTDIDTRTLNLIKYHHQNTGHTGYPKVPDDFFADINQQIVTISDKYSALLDARSYKAPLDSKQALTIIYKDVKAGNIHPFVFKALVDYVQNEGIESPKVSAKLIA